MNNLTHNSFRRIIYLFFAFSLILLTELQLIAQETRFFMPNEIKKAYENGTRSYDGKPGNNYWQNTADYKIEVTLDIEKNQINGNEEVLYHNESLDDINMLVVRIYADAYKKGSARLLPVNEKDLHDGVELSDIQINGKSYPIADNNLVRKSGTNIVFTLEEPLKPGSNLTFKATWSQMIPKIIRERTGVYDSTSYFIAYWYPQIAVYDDIFGWDNLQYDFLTEFYNNLSNFDVTIHAPKEFAVWATGELENAHNVLPEHVYENYITAKLSDDPVRILSHNELENGRTIFGDKWHYVAQEVSDFAFAVSNRHCWDAISLKMDDRTVLVNSVYPNDTTQDFSNHISMQLESMKHQSEDIPGIPYPYPVFTTFITGSAGGGMEYPMMANNGGPGENVTIHEMFHTYFPMYVRINERRWAWMDEGWADFVTASLIYKYFDEESDISKFYAKINPSALSISGTSADLPLITSSQFMTNQNYGYASYQLPAFVYAILQDELGKEVFLECLRTYIRTWAKKSPTPYDFFCLFENASGKDLSWIWKPWFFEYGYPDLAIKSFSNSKLTINNLGNKPVPIVAVINYKNSESKIITQKSNVWKNGNNEYQLDIPESGNVKNILVNTSMADIDLNNNLFPSVKSMYGEISIPSDIVGEYKANPYGFNFKIVSEDEILYFNTSWGWHKVLYPNDDFSLITLDQSITFDFKENETDSTTGPILNWFGTDLSAEKLR